MNNSASKMTSGNYYVTSVMDGGRGHKGLAETVANWMVLTPTKGHWPYTALVDCYHAGPVW